MSTLPRFRFVARAVGGATTPEWHFPQNEQFYWHGVRDPVQDFGDFTVDLVNSDGSQDWTLLFYDSYFDEYYLRFEFWELYSWPGWPQMGVTSRGAFMPVVGELDEDGDKISAFYVVQPDGTPGGLQLAVKAPAGQDGQWGIEASEGGSGDHYVLYYAPFNAHSDLVVIAGWEGAASTKWVVTAGELVSSGVLIPYEWNDIYATPASATLSPDYSVYVVLFSDNTLAGFRAGDGHLLWFTRDVFTTAGRHRWEGNMRVRFSPYGHAFVQTMDRTGNGSYDLGYAHRLDFVGGYVNPPTLGWSYSWAEPGAVSAHMRIDGMTPLSDGGVVLFGSAKLSGDPVGILRRLDKDGAVLWSQELDVDGAYIARPYDTGYSPIASDETHAFIPWRDTDYAADPYLRRVELGAGEFDEDDSDWPLFFKSHYGMISFRPSSVPVGFVGNEPIERAAYAEHAGGLLVFGGWDWDAVERDTVYSYDPVKKWTELTALPFPFSSFGTASAVIGDWVYVLGYKNAVTENVFFRYNVLTGVTEELASAPWVEGPATAFGGLVYAGLASTTPRVYDPSTNTWSTASGTTPYVSDHLYYGAVVDDDSIIVVGGYSEGPVTMTNLAYRYTPGTGTWQALPNLPTAMHAPLIVNYDGDIIVTMGSSAFSTPTGDSFRLDGSSWQALSPPAFLRSYAAGGVVGDLIVVTGGYDAVAGYPDMRGFIFVPEEA